MEEIEQKEQAENKESRITWHTRVTKTIHIFMASTKNLQPI